MNTAITVYMQLHIYVRVNGMYQNLTVIHMQHQCPKIGAVACKIGGVYM